MTKIISAQSILKEKGYVQNKFDTNGFMQVVAKFFLDNSVESKLLLVPYRFLDIKRDRGEGFDTENPLRITPEEEKLGYKDQTAKNEIGEPAYVRWGFENDFEELRLEQEYGIAFDPRIIIDKPFFENAAATLRLMGGYVVEKQMMKRRKVYWVTLV